MANSTEARGIKPEITLRYWMTALSFNFQINIANSIIQRSMRVNGRLQNRLYHKDSCPEHIVLADSINGIQFNHFQSSPHDHDISFAEFNTECDNSYIPSSIHSYNDFTTSDIILHHLIFMIAILLYMIPLTPLSHLRPGACLRHI